MKILLWATGLGKIFMEENLGGLNPEGCRKHLENSLEDFILVGTRSMCLKVACEDYSDFLFVVGLAAYARFTRGLPDSSFPSVQMTKW